MFGRLKSVIPWLPYLRVVTGLSLIGLLIYYIGGALLLDYWRDIQLSWLFATSLFILISTLIGGFNIHLLLDSHEGIPFHQFLKGYWIAWAMGLVVPGQVGDIASLSVWLRRHGFQWHLSLGCALLDKLISLLWLAILGGFGLWMFVFSNDYEIRRNILLLGGCILMLVLLLFLSREYLTRLVARGRGIIGNTLQTVVGTVLQYKKRVLLNVALTGVKITLIGLAYWSMFLALGHDVLNFAIVIPLVAASSLVAYIPVSFNGLGTVEIAGVALFGWLGIPAAGVVSVYLALRILVILLAWVPAGLIFVFAGHATDNAFGEGER